MELKGRWLGIDHGEARVGLALSDDLGLMAHPLETVPTAKALSRIPEVIAEKKIVGIVLGLPFRLDGTEGPASERVRAFLKRLQPHLPPGIPVHLRDESYSTTTAHAHLRASGKKTKHHRPLIDQAAAVVILQEFLDEQASPGALLLDEEWDG